MNILHLSNTPLSNAPHNLVVCQNDYGHKAELLLHKKSNINKVYVGGSLWNEVPLDKLEQMFLDADILHFHNYCWELKIFQAYPKLKDIALKKPKLIQYHSPRYSVESFEASIADKKLKHAVIAQYHVRFYPECEYVVPNVIPIYDSKYTPIPTKWDDSKPTISYAPSNITLKGWDDKGYHVVDPTLRRLEREGKANIDVMVGVPYEECMLKKRWAHIGIDEPVTGSYHLSSLEYLSMGCVTVAYLDAQTVEAISQVTSGADELPWWRPAKPEQFEEFLRFIMTLSMGELKSYGNLGRRWMEKHWNPKDHVKRFEQIYGEL